MLVVPNRQGVEEILWSRDGAWIVFREGGGLSGGTRDVLYTRAGGEDTPEPILATAAEERVPSLSPDGRWIAFVSDQDGTNQVYVRPFPDGDGEWRISAEGGIEPLWSPRDDEIFYRSDEQMMMAASVETTPSFALLGERRLFGTDAYRTENNHRAYDVTSDGQRFLMIRATDEGGELVWVQNFFEELRQVVPN